VGASMTLRSDPLSRLHGESASCGVMGTCTSHTTARAANTPEWRLRAGAMLQYIHNTSLFDASQSNCMFAHPDAQLL